MLAAMPLGLMGESLLGGEAAMVNGNSRSDGVAAELPIRPI